MVLPLASKIKGHPYQTYGIMYGAGTDHGRKSHGKVVDLLSVMGLSVKRRSIIIKRIIIKNPLATPPLLPLVIF
jgi:hypothetical protein